MKLSLLHPSYSNMTIPVNRNWLSRQIHSKTTATAYEVNRFYKSNSTTPKIWWGLLFIMFGHIIQVFGTALAFVMMSNYDTLFAGFITMVGAHAIGLLLIYLSKFMKT